MNLVGFCDASFATGSKGRSIDGYVVYLNGMILSYKSRQQKTVALSTSECEYVAAVNVAKKLIFLGNLLENLGFKIDSKKIMCDNLGAIYIAKGANPTKIKHPEVKLFWLRQIEEEEDLQIEFVSSEENLADTFTKALPRPKFEKFPKDMLN